MSRVTTRRDDVTKRWVAEAIVGGKEVVVSSGPVEAVSEAEVLRHLAIALAYRLEQIHELLGKTEQIPLPQIR